MCWTAPPIATASWRQPGALTKAFMSRLALMYRQGSGGLSARSVTIGNLLPPPVKIISIGNCTCGGEFLRAHSIATSKVARNFDLSFLENSRTRRSARNSATVIEGNSSIRSTVTVSWSKRYSLRLAAALSGALRPPYPQDRMGRCRLGPESFL